MDPKSKIIAGLGVFSVLVVVLIAASLIGGTNQDLVQKHQEQVHELTGRIKQLESTRVMMDDKIQTLKAENDFLTINNELYKKKYALILIPQKKEAPSTDPELRDALVAGGITNTLAIKVTEPVLDHNSAVKIWDWYSESLRVPVLLTKIEAGDKLISNQVEIIKNNDVQKIVFSEQITNLKETNKLQEQRFTNRTAELEAYKKVAKAERIKWYYKIAGTAALGYVVGRARK